MDSEKAVDASAPAKIDELTVALGRGHSTEEGGGCSGSSGPGDSCAGIGRIAIYPKVPADDRTPPEKMGYVIKLETGTSPVVIPPGAVRTYNDGAIHLIWDDGETNDQDSFDFTVVVHAVDLAGNVSEPSEPLRISDSGGDDGGCATRSPKGAAASLWPAIAALVAVRRLTGRRRRNHARSIKR